MRKLIYLLLTIVLVGCTSKTQELAIVSTEIVDTTSLEIEAPNDGMKMISSGSESDFCLAMRVELEQEMVMIRILAKSKGISEQEIAKQERKMRSVIDKFCDSLSKSVQKSVRDSKNWSETK